MGRFWFDVALAGAALTMAVPVAGAPTVITSGNYAGGDSVFRDGNLSLGPGAYRFSLWLTSDVDAVEGFVTNSRVTSMFCDFRDGAGEVYCGGDDVPTEPLLDPAGPRRYLAMLTVEPPSTILTPSSVTVRTETFDECCTFQFGFDANEAGSFSFAYSAVPEPITWALMIAGLGAVAAALRRRSRPGSRRAHHPLTSGTRRTAALPEWAR